jgi:DNA-binding MarR family transcriptional regulator
MPYPHNKTHEIRMLNMLIMKISRQLVEQRFAQDGLDLTMFQFVILSMAKNDTITLTDISKRMGTDPSTLVPMVDALVKKGYLKRERDPEDRRRYPLVITEAGLALQLNANQCMKDDPLDAALSNFEDVELEQLRLMLRRIVMQMPEGEAALAEIEQHEQAHKSDKGSQN